MNEKIDYRNNLTRLDCAYPHQEMLSLNDVAIYTGIDKRQVLRLWQSEFINTGTAKRHSLRISKAKLARLLS